MKTHLQMIPSMSFRSIPPASRISDTSFSTLMSAPTVLIMLTMLGARFCQSLRMPRSKSTFCPEGGCSIKKAKQGQLRWVKGAGMWEGG